MKYISDRLKELRGAESQTAVAKRLGISQQGWARYETGKILPGAEMIRQICSKFNISADWLLGLSDVRTTTQSIEPPMIGLNKRQSLQRDDVAFELAAIRRQLEQQKQEIAALKKLNQTPTACCA